MHAAQSDLARRFYDAYNHGGPPDTRGLNHRGESCPAWDDLPEVVRAKWTAVADLARALSLALQVEETAGAATAYEHDEAPYWIDAVWLSCRSCGSPGKVQLQQGDGCGGRGAREVCRHCGHAWEQTSGGIVATPGGERWTRIPWADRDGER